MSMPLGLIGFYKQNRICRVFRLLSNMVLQANTSIFTATPAIFIKWHPCQIKELVSNSESRFALKVPLKTSTSMTI